MTPGRRAPGYPASPEGSDFAAGFFGVVVGEVGFGDGLGVVEELSLTVLEPEGAVAQGGDIGGAVGDEKKCACFAELVDPAHTLLDEKDVTDGEGFVDAEDVGFDMGHDSESHAQAHARGVSPDGLIHEVADFSEGADVVEDLVDFLFTQAEAGAVEVDVFTAGEFWIETAAKLKEGGDAALAPDGAGAGSEGAGDHLQEGALA